MDEDKPKLGFQLTDELSKEFRKIGTAGYPIHAINKASGQTFSIVGYETERIDPLPGTRRNGYRTWIILEEDE